MRLKDEACTAAGFEKLVTYYPNPAGWANLMQSLFEARNEAAAFNAYRLATDVGAMRRADDYTEMAQRAIEQGLPGEAQKTLEAAFAAKVFTEKRDIDRNQRLLNSAKERAAADRASLAKQDRDAAANKSADADIRVGQAYMSYGQYPQAVAALQRGIGKGTATDPAEAQLVLGIAHLRGGNKAEAAKAFRAVKGDQDMQRIAKLWSLRAQ
jgi:tetratricopeptide (TPR) repeat protein